MKTRFLLFGFFLLLLIVLYGLFDPAAYPFPQCPFKTYTGWLCPGCGSQRAIHHALHGRFMESMTLNILFIPAIVYALAAVITSILFPGMWPRIRTHWYGIKAAWISLAIIMIFWICRNIF